MHSESRFPSCELAWTLRRTLASICLFLALHLVPVTTSLAAEPVRYPAAKHSNGELKYINGLPVLVVSGIPEEIGEQIGVLGMKPFAGLLTQFQDTLKAWGWERMYPLFIKTGNLMLPQFPPDHRRELEAIAKTSGVDRDLLVFANTIPDMMKLVGCSTLIIEPSRSTTGQPLFGRNLDWPPVGSLHENTLVTVYRPRGKHAFASIGYPPMLGCPSGINDAGLCLAQNEVYTSRDGSPRFNPTGTPMLLAFRRILEECTTIQEAEQLLRSLQRTKMCNLTVCDKTGGAVFEITPKSLVVRRPRDGIAACTNHFRTQELATSLLCSRYALLEKNQKLNKFGVTEVARQLHAVNQGTMTLQTMIFEPAALRLHLAFGKGPATALPLKRLELAPLLRAD
jgi:hypothetical protein